MPHRRKGLRPVNRALAVLVALSIAAGGQAAEWTTDDGLSVTLDNATADLTSLAVDGEPLPLIAGERGGLFVQEFTRPDAPPQDRLLLDFGAEDAAWLSAVGAEWDAEQPYAERVEAGGETFLRLGDGEQAGAGMATAHAIPMRPGELLTISWRARAPEPGMTMILCLRPLNADGEDISATAPAPSGWQHTPYSRAHYIVGFRPSQDWSAHSCDYVVPPGVAAARLSLRVYLGGALRADIDDLRLTVRPGGWGDEHAVIGPVSGDRVLTQSVILRAMRFETQYRAHPGHLSAEVTVRSDGDRTEPRAFRLIWRLPLDATGWRWAAAPDEAEEISRDARYEDPLALGGHVVGRFPLATISGPRTAIALATSLDPPALQGFSYDARGLSTTADLALSPEAPDAIARLSFALYRHEPAWDFRAALERYYALFPDLFSGRAGRGGCWTLRLPDPEIEAPGDFGLAFYECHGAGEQDRAWCRQHGLRTFRYIEPWGVRQTFPDAGAREQMPPLEERLAQLRAWAREEQTDATWLGAPRNRMARAVLASVVIGPEGAPIYREDLYSHWATWWQTNSDPDLPSPNRADLCRETRIDPALEWADGIYVDSVSGAHTSQEDHAPDHLAAADLPLTFSLQTGTPIVLSGLAHGEFLTWLRDYLRERDRLLMFNMFTPATRLFGHLPDVTGCELTGPADLDRALAQRVYARHRPVSNLLQWKSAVLKRVPAASSEEMREYFDNQLLYGFWPGISTAGGGAEPGYAGLQRYFRTPELLERDRELFREYIPVFNALNEAGWEPVPYIRGEPGLHVERFGDDLLAVHNPHDSTVTGALLPEVEWWGEIERTEYVGGGEDPFGGRLLTLRPRSTVVLRVVRRGR